MAFSNKIELSFDGGLITDLEAAKLPANAASRLENADIRNGFLSTFPGLTEVNAGLDASFVKISEEQFLFTSPSEQNVTLVYGTLASVDKLYVRPYLASDGTWTDSWLDLTEKEGNYTDSVISSNTLQSNSLLSTTNDYYNGWTVYCVTSDRGSAIVTAYVGSTKTLTLSWAIPSMASGNTFFLVRNPIYKRDGTTLFAPSSSGCRFMQRENVIDIVTGSDVAYQSGSIKSDLILVAINNRAALDDTDLTYTGFYLTRKPPAGLESGTTTTGAALLSSTAVAATGDDIMTTGTYVFLAVPVYDGFQEGTIDPGNYPFDGTTYNAATTVGLYQFHTVSIGSNQSVQIVITLFYGQASSTSYVQLFHMPELPKNSSSTDYIKDFIIFDRRITSIRIYGATLGSAVLGAKITSEIRFIEEVKIDSSDWSGSGPSYTQTIQITKPKYDANAGIDIADRQGHSSLRIHTNANFIVSAKNRVSVGNVYADEKRQSFVFFSAVNSDSQNTPDVTPHTSFLDLSLYGIPKILGFVEADGFLVALGENKIVKIDASTTLADKNTQQRGVSSVNGTISIDNFVYFVSLEDCYRYSPRFDVAPSIMTGFVKEAWKALTTANKQAAAIGYDGNYNILVIAAGTQIYLYNIPQTFASDLAQDTQAIGGWSVYSVNTTFLKFYTAPDKSCVGIANDGKAYTLFGPNVANTMIYEKILGEADLNIHTLRLIYEATATVTAKIFDKLKGDTYPIRTFNFPAQSIHKRKDQHKGAQVKRPRLQISAPVGTKISKIVVNPDPLTDLR